MSTPAVHRRAARAYQRRHRAAGLCEKCQRPAVSATRCQRHRVSDRAYYRKKVKNPAAAGARRGPRNICTVDGCGRLTKARWGRLCNLHFCRARSHGTPHWSPATLEERLWRFIEPEPNSGCWLWTGGVNNMGYAQIWIGRGRHGSAHRVAYELYVGPIPGGLELLHRCDVRPCVNPAHLLPGTRLDNVRDAMQKGRLTRRKESAHANS